MNVRPMKELIRPIIRPRRPCIKVIVPKIQFANRKSAIVLFGKNINYHTRKNNYLPSISMQMRVRKDRRPPSMQIRNLGKVNPLTLLGRRVVESSSLRKLLMARRRPTLEKYGRRETLRVFRNGRILSFRVGNLVLRPRTLSHRLIALRMKIRNLRPKSLVGKIALKQNGEPKKRLSRPVRKIRGIKRSMNPLAENSSALLLFGLHRINWKPLRLTN